MSVTYDFSGRTAIVTGGARGIGRAIAHKLSLSGADVWIWDIEPVELEGTRSLSVDVTKRDNVMQALTIMGEVGVDILVNNAGWLGGYKPFEEFEPAEWQRILQVNLLGTFEVTHREIGRAHV